MFINLNGQWSGTVTYGKEYNKISGKQVRFKLDMTQTGQQFTGISMDVDGYGLNLPQPCINFLQSGIARAQHLLRHGVERRVGRVEHIVQVAGVAVHIEQAG